jgi:hypothetical protein
VLLAGKPEATFPEARQRGRDIRSAAEHCQANDRLPKSRRPAPGGPMQ